MGQQLSLNCAPSWTSRIQGKPPSKDQSLKVRELADSLILLQGGRAAGTVAARARAPEKSPESYGGAALPRAPFWKSWFASCCASTDADVDFGDSSPPDLVDRVAPEAPELGPGPPQDAPPATFLGPAPPRVAEPPSSRGDRAAYDADTRGRGYGPAAAGKGKNKVDMVAETRQGSAASDAKAYGTYSSRGGAYAKRSSGYDSGKVVGSESAGGGGYGAAAAAGLTEEERAQGELAKIAAQEKGFKKRYTLGARLNAGAQGVTYLATANYSGASVVVKRPNKPADTSDYTLLSTKSHPNIVRVYELFQDSAQTSIVMEYCRGGDLFHAIEDLGASAITQHWASGVFRQVVWGVRYLHDYFKEVHNDIKPENIFLDRPSRSQSDVPRAMIGDFGCLAPIGQATFGGDPRYRAPETFEVERFNTASDMWALGATLYEIATGGHVVYTHAQNMSSWAKFRDSGRWDPLREKLVEGFPVPLDKLGIGDDDSEMEDLKSLLSGLLDTRTGSRYTALQAIEHPWLQLDVKGEHVPFDEDTAAKLGERSRRHVLDIALLNLVGEMLQGQSIEHYQAMWNRYDANTDGTMDREEFARMVQEMGIEGGRKAGAYAQSRSAGASQPTLEELFALVDANENGTIDFREFVGWMFDPSALSDEERAAFLKQAFNIVAQDDGTISAEDLVGLFVSQGVAQQSASETCMKLFRAMDADASGCISYSEFAAYVDCL